MAADACPSIDNGGVSGLDDVLPPQHSCEAADSHSNPCCHMRINCSLFVQPWVGSCGAPIQAAAGTCVASAAVFAGACGLEKPCWLVVHLLTGCGVVAGDVEDDLMPGCAGGPFQHAQDAGWQPAAKRSIPDISVA